MPSESGFTFIVRETFSEMSRAAADKIAEELKAKPDLLLCAATGSSPTPMYEHLVTRKKTEPSLYNSFRLLKLDEWGGLPMGHAGSCETYLQKHLVQPLDVSSERYISFQSQAEPDTECRRVGGWLSQNGPIDVCILGLGLNGHLGFNEPADALQARAHRAVLAASSLQHPMIRESKISLSYGLTLGMADILQSRTIILLVNGAHKADAMKQLLSRMVTTQFPASFLWLHPRVFCFCDRAAAPSEISTS